MTTNKLQMEWDHGSYVRKFHQTLAFVQVGDALPGWMWVAAIGDNHIVYENARQEGIGQIVCQATKGEVHHDTGKYPIVQFFYKTIMPGAYWSKERTGVSYLIKRHLKSYKIGLSDETFNIYAGGKGASILTRVHKGIDLSAPVIGYQNLGNCEVFSQKVVRMGTNLFADGDSIGFMEGGVCMLRHKNFHPLISSLLEGKWQIES